MQVALAFLRYWLFDFTRHLSLIGVLVVLGAIVFARVGRALGIDRLFWHERRSVQLRAGAASALLVAKVCFVGYLLDAARVSELPGFGGASPAPRAHEAALYLALSLVPISLVYTLLGLLALRARGRVRETPRAWFVLGAALGIVAGGLLLLGVAPLLPEDSAFPDWLLRALLLRPDDLPPSTLPLHLLAALFVLALCLEYVAYAMSRQRFTPAMAICTLLGLLTGATGFLEFRAWNASAVVLGAVALLALGGWPRYKLRIAPLRARYRTPHILGSEPAGEPYPSVYSEQIPWRRSDGQRRPLVLVSASGGGLRAALWTADVLSELELSLPEFASSIRLIAGASGGMVGASAYTLSLLPRAARGAYGHVLSRDELLDRLGQDSLSGAIERLVFRDLPFTGLPFVNRHDRGEALEESWQRALGPCFDASFGELLERERTGDLPSLVFSPMLVEDGRRLLISNLSLDFLVGQVKQAHDSLWLSRAGFELARMFPAEFARFPLRTAARLSAAFPYVSPAVFLPTYPRRRVVDAGYYDNFGVNVCAGFLADCFSHPMRRAWIEDNVSRVLLVQLRDQVSPLQGQVQRAREGSRSGALRRGLQGLSSPLEGVFASREAVSLFRNDEQLGQVMRLYDAAFEPGFVRSEIFAYPGEASLSWYLSRAERAAIRHAARTLAPQLEVLSKFWGGDLSPAAPPVGLHIGKL